MRDYPVSKTQQMVLDALHMTARGFGDAERKFAELGLVVASKREGRSTVPVVKIKDRMAGGWEDGSGVSYEQYQDIDTAALEQWIE